jgi:hypothetical protein
MNDSKSRLPSSPQQGEPALCGNCGRLVSGHRDGECYPDTAPGESFVAPPAPPQQPEVCATFRGGYCSLREPCPVCQKVNAEEAALPQQPPQEWEAFCDASYFDMWAVRPIGENRWGHCFHLPSKDEAEGLRSILNKSSSTPATPDVAKAMLNALYEILPYLNELRTEAYHRLAPIAYAAVKLAEATPAAAQTFEEWWDEQIRLAQIFLGSGDYWVSKGIAKKAWNAARGGR